MSIYLFICLFRVYLFTSHLLHRCLLADTPCVTYNMYLTQCIWFVSEWVSDQLMIFTPDGSRRYEAVQKYLHLPFRIVALYFARNTLPFVSQKPFIYLTLNIQWNCDVTECLWGYNVHESVSWRYRCKSWRETPCRSAWILFYSRYVMGLCLVGRQ